MSDVPERTEKGAEGEQRSKAPRRTLEIQGHRGFGDDEPHNTLRAFRAAAALPGVHGVEFDVQCSSDGHLVVTHGQENEVPTLTLAQLQEPDLGHGERVPIFADVVDVCLAGGLSMNVELKSSEPSVADATLAILRDKAALGRFSISSFHRVALEHVMKVAPEVPIGILYNPGGAPTPDDYLTWFGSRSVPGDSINLRHGLATRENMLEIKRHGKRAMLWCTTDRLCGTAQEETAEEYRRLIDLGPDILCANRLALLVKVVAEGAAA